ncbi:MAG: hypothetical protein IIU28_04980 [Lachnospiraceae bacterium]|nr:hypothetical protein [Lachnospiraceae bacterium]
MAISGGNEKSKKGVIPPERKRNSHLRWKWEDARKLESPGGEEKCPFPVEMRKARKARIPRRGREIAISGGNGKMREN